MTCSIIITTTDSIEVADTISNQLIQDAFAKCIWRDEVKSTYLWEGKLVSSKEYRLFIKSNKGYFRKICDKIKEMHNYDVPAIIEIDIKGEENFINWLKG